MSPKFPRKFNGLHKQINIYLWHTKMEYDNFQTIWIEKEEKKKIIQVSQILYSVTETVHMWNNLQIN